MSETFSSLKTLGNCWTRGKKGIDKADPVSASTHTTNLLFDSLCALELLYLLFQSCFPGADGELCDVGEIPARSSSDEVMHTSALPLPTASSCSVDTQPPQQPHAPMEGRLELWLCPLWSLAPLGGDFLPLLKHTILSSQAEKKVRALELTVV